MADRARQQQVGALRVAAAPMAAVTILLLVVVDRYGPHWDALYFGMLPPRWWYVDQPPLTVWLSWLATQVSDAIWVQRLPAVAAAAMGAFVAGLYPRVLGAGPRAQRLAAWAHAFPRSLVWAGAVAGLAAWNKLLVLVLLVALFVGLLLTDRALLRTRHTVLGVGLFGLLAAPQGLAQLLTGMPMSQVSAGLVEAQGDLVRLVLVPTLVLFVGPPLVLVWGAGLVGPWRNRGRPGRFLLPAVLVLVAWTLTNPAQPHYPVAALLPALAMGWASPELRARLSPSRWRTVIVANGVVASLVCLPLLPAAEPWLSLQSRINPAIREQVGWPDYVDQISEVRRDGEGGHHRHLCPRRRPAPLRLTGGSGPRALGPQRAVGPRATARGPRAARRHARRGAERILSDVHPGGDPAGQAGRAPSAHRYADAPLRGAGVRLADAVAAVPAAQWLVDVAVRGCGASTPRC